MTNPTPSAEERAMLVIHSYTQEPRPTYAETLEMLTGDFRQAEQAARADERRKTLEECKQVAAKLGSVVLLNEISALNESGEPGEAA